MSELVEHHGTDVLADVLDSLKLRGRLFCRCELSAPWAIGFAAGVFAHFHVIEQGTCCLQIVGEAKPVTLEEGDLVLVIPRGQSYQLSDDPRTPPIPLSEIVGDSAGGLRAIIRHGAGGAETKLLCGAFEFQGSQAAASLAVFPLCIRVPKRERRANEWLDATVRFLRQETREPSIGSETITTRLIDVMFVEAIRAWLKDQPEGSAGWLGALRDPSIGTALGLIHKNPEKPWTVPSLAAEVGMSRSPFAGALHRAGWAGAHVLSQELAIAACRQTSAQSGPLALQHRRTGRIRIRSRIQQNLQARIWRRPRPVPPRSPEQTKLC